MVPASRSCAQANWSMSANWFMTLKKMTPTSFQTCAPVYITPKIGFLLCRLTIHVQSLKSSSAYSGPTPGMAGVANLFCGPQVKLIAPAPHFFHYWSRATATLLFAKLKISLALKIKDWKLIPLPAEKSQFKLANPWNTTKTYSNALPSGPTT